MSKGKTGYPSGFFRFLWNMNAVLIALMMLATLLFKVLPELQRKLSPKSSSSHISDVVKPPETSPSAPLRFISGVFSDLEGTPVFVANIRVDRLTQKGAGGGVRNKLFFNSESGETRRLFDHNNWLISRTDNVYDRVELHQNGERGKGLAPVRLLAYKIINEDSNGNGVLDPGDNVKLALSRPDGSDFRLIATDDSENHDIYEHTNAFIRQGQLVFMSRHKGRITAHFIDAKSLETIKTVNIPN